MNELEPDKEPIAKTITVSAENFTLHLEDGRRVTIPFAWYPRLLCASMFELQHWEIVGNGYAITWPDLDEHIGVQALLEGRRSGESEGVQPKSLGVENTASGGRVSGTPLARAPCVIRASGVPLTRPPLEEDGISLHPQRIWLHPSEEAFERWAQNRGKWGPFLGMMSHLFVVLSWELTLGLFIGRHLFGPNWFADREDVALLVSVALTVFHGLWGRRLIRRHFRGPRVGLSGQEIVVVITLMVSAGIFGAWLFGGIGP